MLAIAISSGNLLLDSISPTSANGDFHRVGIEGDVAADEMNLS